MKTIDNVAASHTKEIAEIGASLEKLTEINNAVGVSSWAAVDAWIARELNARYIALSMPETTMERTHALRGEIAALLLVRGLPKSVLADIQRGSERAALLRGKLSEWHNAGRPELRSAVDAADAIVTRSQP